MRCSNLSFEAVLSERRLHARDEVGEIGFIIRVLELATAAFGKMPARGFLVVGSQRERAVIEQRVAGHSERDVATTLANSIAARRDADYHFVHQESSSARGIASARSSAIILGPAISAARP